MTTAVHIDARPRGTIEVASPKLPPFRCVPYLQKTTRKTAKGTNGAITKFAELLIPDLNCLDNRPLTDGEVVQYFGSVSEIIPAMESFLARNPCPHAMRVAAYNTTRDYVQKAFATVRAACVEAKGRAGESTAVTYDRLIALADEALQQLPAPANAPAPSTSPSGALKGALVIAAIVAWALFAAVIRR